MRYGFVNLYSGPGISALAAVPLLHHLLVVPLLAARLGLFDLTVLGLEATRCLLGLQDLIQQCALPLLLGHPRAVPLGRAFDQDSDLAKLWHSGLGAVFSVKPAAHPC